jgi:hypothetical protein
LPGTPAYEVDDFKFISVIEIGLGPVIAGHNVAIQFDSDAVGLHAEGFNESGEGGNREIECSFFAIDVEFHDV